MLQNTELFVSTNCVTVQYTGLESCLYLGVWVETSGCVSGATKNLGTRPDVMMIGLLRDNWPIALNF